MSGWGFWGMGVLGLWAGSTALMGLRSWWRVLYSYLVLLENELIKDRLHQALIICLVLKIVQVHNFGYIHTVE